MTAATAVRPRSAAPVRALTLVWLDAREAVVVERVGGRARFEVIESEVPSHHRATGHVRHDPGVRHGGGGRPQTAGEPHRLEHLARYVDAVAARLPPDHDLLVIGPGPVRDHLTGRIAELDARHHPPRSVRTEASERMTRPQLAARLAEAMGIAPRRRTVGTAR